MKITLTTYSEPSDGAVLSINSRRFDLYFYFKRVWWFLMPLKRLKIAHQVES